MTETRLRLLLIEPDDADAQLVADALESLSLPEIADTAYRRQETLAGALAAMKAHEWDVIVSAAGIPDGPAPPELMRVYQEASPQVPVIIMSKMRDETLVPELFAAGMHALLPKDSLDHLAFHAAIHSALEIKRMRDQLSQRSLEMRQLVDGLADGIIVVDANGQFRFANPAAAQLLGTRREDLIGTQARIPLTPGLHTELELEQPDGTQANVDINISFIAWENEGCYLACLRSVAERKRLEAQRIDMERKLLAHQKIESLGLFAGGIAHDFNNLLAGIMGHAEVLNLDIDQDSTSARSVDLIKQASRRAATLCEQLLAYAGKGAVDPTANDFNQLIRSNDELLRTSLGSQVELKLDLAAGIPSVLADASQLTQVLMNLVINAKEAIPHPPGSVAVRTRWLTIGEINLNLAVVAPKQPDASYVGMEVSDGGVGMTEQTISRMFEPFYSTKNDSRGLGLSTVQGIVQGHGGILTVDSSLGRGTTIGIYLSATPDPPPSANPQGQQVATNWNCDASVLIVDDEVQVREAACRILKRFGCQVISASSGDDALTLIALQPNDIDIVLLDLSMPVLSGDETLRAIRKRYRHLKVILMSGFEETHAAIQIGGNHVEGFLKKPFGIEELGATLKRVTEIEQEN